MLISSKTQKKDKKRDDHRDSEDHLRDLPEWLEEFADDLEGPALHAPAHISQDSDSERPTKVVSKSRKQSIYIHFQKTEIEKSAREETKSRKQSNFTHFPNRPNLRSLLSKQNDKGLLAEDVLARLLEQKSLVT